MTWNGTAMYEDFVRIHPLPDLVAAAVEAAQALEFELSVHPATGRLLAALAAGVGDGVIGETGTGTGAGVAWMLSTCPPDTQIVSVELDPVRAEAASSLFAHRANVTVITGEANVLAEHAPFDLLVLDAAADPGPMCWSTFDPAPLLSEHGVFVCDDLWPMTDWPPSAFDGSVDEARARLLSDPNLLTTEVTVAPGYAALLGRRDPRPNA